MRIWAKKGTRAQLPADQRYDNTYLFGAICPMRGAGAALVLPKANTEAMQLHLDEISKYVVRRAHAVVVMAMNDFEPDGTAPASWSYPKTSPSFYCSRNRTN